MSELTLVTRIETILQAERAALRAGSFDALEKIAPIKASIVPHLMSGKLATGHLTRLRHIAARNEAMLAASMEGVRAAATRLAQIREALEPLNTYSQDGERQKLGRGKAKVERRA